MQLNNLLNKIYPLPPTLDRQILGLAQNSQQIAPGYLFLACRGRNFDGLHYIDQALAKGAVAVLAEVDAASSSSMDITFRDQVPIIPISQLTQKLYEIAATFYQYPSEDLQLIGVTGTNGKTSCTHFIAEALQMLQEPCGLIGTLGSGFPGALQETGMTTPDAIQLQRIFSELRAQRAKYVAMEVSSHSLDQGRVQGLDFEVGIFTNLTQDHLDYHGDIATYAAVKKRFFTDYPLRHAIINADDAVGQELITVLPAEKVFGYSLKGAALQVRARERLIYVQKLRFDLSGMRAEVFTPWGDGELYAPLLGEFNLSNVLAVLATLGALGIPLDTVLACLARLAAVPGRMQLFGGAQEPRIIVDYAHTPDALEKTLRAVRQHCQGKLYCVFGCGGERDRGKRPLMGAIAEEHADQVLLTNDNPRHENPQAILAEILAGMKNPERVIVEPNRSKAIQDAIQCAKAGDYILIAGKGAETYQQIGDEKLPFNDGEKILEFLGK